MINLSEIFYSIQGESSFAGFPCIFIRFAGCNLECSYCDTKYADKTEIKMKSEDILSEISRYLPVKLCSITGGEPLLQTEVYTLIRDLHEHDYQIILETNGSLLLDRVPGYVHKIVDIKCPGSGFADCFLWDNLVHLDQEKDEIKFVVSGRSDYDWVLNLLKSTDLKNHRLLISPVVKKVDPEQLASWILQDKLTARLQLQLHRYIWPEEKRGV